MSDKEYMQKFLGSYHKFYCSCREIIKSLSLSDIFWLFLASIIVSSPIWRHMFYQKNESRAPSSLYRERFIYDYVEHKAKWPIHEHLKEMRD